MAKFNVTYETITEESAEHGDAEERGFVGEGLSLRDAVEAFDGFGCAVEANEYPVSDDVRWITAYFVNQDTRSHFEDGITENRSLHFPDSLSAASKRRIMRLFDVRC